jgi:hypothetical protein
MRNLFSGVLAMLLAAVLTGPLLSHHSVAGTYDISKPMALQGIIAKIEFRNPHTVMDLDVRNASGGVTRWRIEIAGTNALARVGLDTTFFDLGKSYSIEVCPAFDGSNHATGRKLTLADGRTFDIRDNWGMNTK